MNLKSVGRFISQILLIEAGLLVPALLLSLSFGEPESSRAFLITVAAALVLALWLRRLCRGAAERFHEAEGLVCVGLSWIVLSLIGCLPFFLSGQIPRFMDALFETVSGFTTTGATILTDVEALDRSLLYWRSFTHWIGGMGVLVFLLALSPGSSGGSGYTMHLLRAESPGPSVGKLVPRIRQTARILYSIYIVLTLIDFVLLLFAPDLDCFQAFCIAVGTAGTGGFAVTNAGLAGNSAYVQIVTTVFMFLFGINFSCYYLILIGKIRSVLHDDELRGFLCTAMVAVLLICWNIRPLYNSFGEALRHAFFQIGSIASTTGFATTDFNLWPSFSKGLLIFFTFMGACAGSTCGGMKFSRVMLIGRDLRRGLQKMLHPNRVLHVRNNGEVVSEQVIGNTHTYLSAYVILLFASFLLLTLEGKDLVSTFTAVLTCFNNVGPGLGEVGPMGNFSAFTDFSKLVLILDMLAGRLELFPILVLFSRDTWGRK